MCQKSFPWREWRFSFDVVIRCADALVRYDSLVPRMTAVLATTSNTTILSSVTTILERALTDSHYTFPTTGILSSESMSSLHQKSYSASISSAPSATGAGGATGGARGEVLDELGMRGLGEMGFPNGRMER
jgi:neurofibromin 1